MQISTQGRQRRRPVFGWGVSVRVRVASFREGDFIFFAFNLIGGGPLYRHIRAGGGLSLERSKYYAAEVRRSATSRRRAKSLLCQL